MLRVSLTVDEYNTVLRLIQFGDASRPMRTEHYRMLMRDLDMIAYHYVLFLDTNHRLHWIDY